MRKNVIDWAGFLVVATLFMLLFSPATSPLFPRYGWDSALFRVVGVSLAEGQSLYTDVWDHKGPVFFAYQAIAQAILPGRLGIFAFQVIILSLVLLFINQFARRFLGRMQRVSLFVIVLTFYGRVFDGGNLTEEFSLVFICLVLVLLTRGWKGGPEQSFSPPAPLWTLAASGAAFAVVVFVRLNNALPIFAVFLAYFVVQLIEKRRFWLPFLTSVGAFFITSIAISLPFVIAGSFAEMMNASFFFNFRYVQGNRSIGAYVDMIGTQYFDLAMLAVVTCLIGGLSCLYWARDIRYFVLCATLVPATILGAFAGTKTYMHYLQLAIPALAVGLVLLLRLIQGRARLVSLALVIVLCIPQIAFTIKRDAALTASQDSESYAADVDEILALIPEGEVEEVYPWLLPSHYYLLTGSLPKHRYFTHQEWWGASAPEVLEEAFFAMAGEGPVWVLTTKDGPRDQRVLDWLSAEYELVYRNNSLSLFQRT